MKTVCSKLALMAMLVVSSVLVSGCGDGVPTLADVNKDNITRVHSMYMMYMNNHNFTGPDSKEQLKEYLTTDNTAKVLVKRMGVDMADFESLFVSERDGEEFEVRWGLKGIADHAIVFEKVGLEGKRFVCFAKAKELGDSEYSGYLSGDIEPEGPGADANIAQPDDMGGTQEDTGE